MIKSLACQESISARARPISHEPPA